MFVGLLKISYICATFRCGNSSVGRALASQAEGHGFEPRLPLRYFKRFLPEETLSVFISYQIFSLRPFPVFILNPRFSSMCSALNRWAFTWYPM